MDKVNLKQKLRLNHIRWEPKIVGELNGQHVRLAKFQGEFVWHKHELEDELFLVVSGAFDMQYRDRTVTVDGRVVPVETDPTTGLVRHALPAGKHVVRWLWRPFPALRTARLVSLVGLGIAIALLAAGAVVSRRSAQARVSLDPA